MASGYNKVYVDAKEWKDTIKLDDRLLYVGDPQSSIRLGEYMRQQMEDEQ
jgi:hypothetical protein